MRKDKMIKIIFPYKEILYKQVMWSTQGENCQNKMMSYQKREIMWHGVTTSTQYNSLFFPIMPFNKLGWVAKPVERHDGGEKAKCIDGINTTIYYNENSHNHMIWSHDWLTHQLQQNPPDFSSLQKRVQEKQGYLDSIILEIQMATAGASRFYKCLFSMSAAEQHLQSLEFMSTG